MAVYVYWFLLALLLLGLEIATGTFYLLILAVAIAIGGIFALLGFSFALQLTFTALAGIIGIVLLRRWKGSHLSDAAGQSLDIGQPVKVLTWREDGTARVFYRGTEWNAELETENIEREGVFYISEIRGSVLVLTHRKMV